MSKETEVFGVNYERFSVGKKLAKLAKKYDIKTVLEMPARWGAVYENRSATDC